MIRAIARTYRNAYSGLPRELWLLSFVLVVNRAGGMVLPFIALYLTQEQGLSVVDAGRILAVYGLGAIVGAYLGGWLSDRIGATRTQGVSLIASGVGYLAILWLDGTVELTAGIFFLSIAVESFRPASCLRKYEVTRTGDGKLLAEAMTEWAYVDLESGRPKRVPDELAAAFKAADD